MTAELLRKMSEMGLTLEQAIELFEAMAKPLSPGARRQRAYRARVAITNDVTRDVSGDVTAPLPLPSSPQPPQQPTPTPDVNTTRARGFAEFWSAYPNKVGKRDAEKRYAEALKRITGPDPPGQILDGVIRAQTSRKWLDGIIPNPATWLFQDRWEDQPSEVIPLQPRRAPDERPHHDVKLAARQANLAALERGADLAARLHGKP